MQGQINLVQHGLLVLPADVICFVNQAAGLSYGGQADAVLCEKPVLCLFLPAKSSMHLRRAPAAPTAR